MEKIRVIKSLYIEPSWTGKQVEDAARGFANGSCDDPPHIVAKAFLEFERNRSEATMQTVNKVRRSLFREYVLGKHPGGKI